MSCLMKKIKMHCLSKKQRKMIQGALRMKFRQGKQILRSQIKLNSLVGVHSGAGIQSTSWVCIFVIAHCPHWVPCHGDVSSSSPFPHLCVCMCVWCVLVYLQVRVRRVVSPSWTTAFVVFPAESRKQVDRADAQVLGTEEMETIIARRKYSAFCHSPHCKWTHCLHSKSPVCGFYIRISANFKTMPNFV